MCFERGLTMVRRGKKSYLEEFSNTIGRRKFKSVPDLEQAFNTWMRSMNYDFTTFGKKFSESDFYEGADYTVTILKKDKYLMRKFGLTEDALVRSRPDYRDVTDKPYSFWNQLKHYSNQGHNYRQRSDVRKKGHKAAFNTFGGGVFLFAIALVVLYVLLGDTIYNFMMQGAFFKLILIGISALITFRVLKSKKMGWPLPIKLIVLFVIWLVVLNYNG